MDKLRRKDSDLFFVRDSASNLPSQPSQNINPFFPKGKKLRVILFQIGSFVPEDARVSQFF
jgi:hypothetical protein